MTPSSRSCEILRADGWHVEIVEQNRRAGIKAWKIDLWGWCDLLCIHPDGRILAVQVTSASNMSSRRKKIADSPLTALVRNAEIAIELHGWRKASNGRWVVKREDLS